jgi:hypothetical protein
MGRGLVRWRQATSRLVPMRVSVAVSMSKVHLVRDILGGLHRSACRWGQPRQPSYMFIFGVRRYANVKLTSSTIKRHIPFELAPLLIRGGALEDRADEQESPCAVVEFSIVHPRFLQAFVNDLKGVGTSCIGLWVWGEAEV